MRENWKMIISVIILKDHTCLGQHTRTIQSVSIIMQNINGGNRGIMWSIDQYINPGRISTVFKLNEKAENRKTTRISEISKNSTLKGSSYLGRAE